MISSVPLLGAPNWIFSEMVSCVFYFGLKVVFPGEGEPLYVAMRVVRYALVGLWAVLGAPWLFLRLRLASSE